MGDLNVKKFKYEYVYVLLFVSICIFMICKVNSVSQYIFYRLESELIPLAGMKNKGDNLFLAEFIPVAKLDELNNCEWEYDLSYDDFSCFNMDTGDNELLDVSNVSNVSYDTDDLNNQIDNQINNQINNVASDSDSTPVLTDVVSPNDVSPIAYSMDDLRNYDFLVTNCYAVDTSTSVNPDEINADNLLGMDMTIDTSGEDYKVLVYHTHGSETFADSRPGVIEDTVIGVGDELARLLNEKGIKTYHDRGIYDTVDGVLDRSYAYTLSGNAVDSILAQYPSIEVVLDIHRDGVREDLRLVRVVNGKPTAQIMFLNGVSRLNINGDIDYLYNPNKIANLAFSLQMHLKGKALYGDLMRRIYIRGYSFNLEKMERASLVEVGAQTNTVEEAKNAMIPLANIIYDVICGQ